MKKKSTKLNSKELARFIVTVPKEVESVIRAEAIREKRNRNAQINVILERFVKEKLSVATV